jgi:integrase
MITCDWSSDVCSSDLEAGKPNLRPHHLRHTCATLLIARGWHAKDIQEWLGHSSYQVTMDVYGHFFPERLHDIADDLDALRHEHHEAAPVRAVENA